MNINIVSLHELVDKWYQEQLQANQVEPADNPPEDKRELPKNKRVVRTKSQGDKVFYLDEEKKTRQAILGSEPRTPSGPEIVESLGFQMGDVQEVEDSELIKYQMSTAIYKLADEPKS